MDIADELEKRQKRLKVTQKDLAKLIGVSAPYLCNVMNRNVERPSQKILDYLGVAEQVSYARVAQ
jgi:predicted transcriptional regulator